MQSAWALISCMIVSNSLTFRFDVSLSRAYLPYSMVFHEGLIGSALHTTLVHEQQSVLAPHVARDEHPHPHCTPTQQKRRSLRLLKVRPPLEQFTFWWARGHTRKSFSTANFANFSPHNAEINKLFQLIRSTFVKNFKCGETNLKKNQ